jgi:SAM-dependent methyltransferase
MIRQLKTLGRRVLPQSAQLVWGRAYGQLKVHRAHRALAAGRPAGPVYLAPAELDALMRDGYRPPLPIRYDPEGLVKRAAEKVRRLEQKIDLSSIESALELGCWDGMVARDLVARGIRVCGLDVVTDGIDARARKENVRFVQSDAEQIALGDASIDLIYTFASFEHFPHPDRVIPEVHRVLRRGGYAFLDFGPLYFSPYGLHAYRQIPVPFCHLLFEDRELHAWAETNGLPHAWPFVNGWSLTQYRQLWASVDAQFRVLSYQEHSTGGVGMELVRRFSECFRGRVADLDELLVSHVDITLEKR